MKRKLLLMIVATLSITGFVVYSNKLMVFATEEKQTINEYSQMEQGYIINDVYKDFYSEEDIQNYFISEKQEIAVHTATEEKIPYFDDYQEVLTYVRSKLVERSEIFKFTVTERNSTVLRENKLCDILLPLFLYGECMDEGTATSIKEGDYLKSNYHGMTYNVEYSFSQDYLDGNYSGDEWKDLCYNTYIIRPIYNSTAEQEAQVDAMLPEVMASLQLEDKNAYEKIKAIHDYIVTHIEYDYDELDYYYETGKSNPEAHSTYSALVKGKTVCQGYASLFYRMCKEAGINVRFICGRAGDPHAWNIVELDGKWYNMDVMSDDDVTSIGYRYFLKSGNAEVFQDYNRYDEYKSAEFNAAYPMATEDYPMPEEPSEPEEPKDPDPDTPAPEEPEEPDTPVPDEPEDPAPEPEEPEIKPIPFTDVPANSWKYDVVSYVYNNNIMNGIAGTALFDPDSRLTRAMFATILYRMAGSPAVSYDTRFYDVPADKWYSNAVIWAASTGIVKGFADGNYGIDVNISREQIAKMLYEYGNTQGYDMSSRASLHQFTDKDVVSGWAAGYMQWAVGAGMISGKPNGDGNFRLDPKGDATRAECAKMVKMFMENVR